MPEEDRIADIIGDWIERRERGEDAPADEVIREHPEIAAELREHFDALGLVARHLDQEWLPVDDPPRQIGDYRIVREIGRGGMGVVYEAEQVTMGRRVALKVLSPAVTSVDQAVRRFHREARAAGQLHHTSVVPVYGMGEDRGLNYYAMELVEGETVAEVVAGMCQGRDSGSGEGDVLGLSSGDGTGFASLAIAAAGVAEALKAAHQEGIIHRDVKPTNLLLSRDGTLKLVDFGLARLAGEGAALTVTGQIIGTPHYMSPEQAAGRQVRIDPRTDVYSLGATLYEILTLRTPFQGESLQEICSQILTRDPMPIRKVNPQVPRDLETIVTKAMEKDRDRRYASAGELAADLRRFAEGMPIRARRIGAVGQAMRKVGRHKVRTALALSVVALLAVGGALAFLAAREGRRRAELEYERLCLRAQNASVRAAAGGRLVGSLHGAGAPESHALPEVVEAAAALFTRAIDLDPDRHEAWLGRALAPGREVKERLADLAESRKCGIDLNTFRLARAHVLGRAGRWDEADVEQNRATDAPPDSATAAFLEGWLRDVAGERRAARELYDRAVTLSSRISSIRYLALVHRADLNLRVDNHDAALADLHAARGMGDEGPRLIIQIACVQLAMGRDQAAERTFASALHEVRERDSVTAWEELCQACRNVRDWSGRVTEEARRRHGNSTPLLRERAVFFARAERFDEALALCERASASGASSSALLVVKGDALRGLGLREDALEAYGHALSLDDRNHTAQNGKAFTFFKMCDFGSALTAFDRAIELNPGNFTLRCNRAVTLKLLGRHDEALAGYDETLRLAPGHLRGRLNRASLLAHQLGRPGEALEEVTRIMKLDSCHPRTHFELGRVLSRLGEHARAIKSYRETLRLEPDYDTAHEMLARSHSALGQDEEARQEIDRVVEDARGRPGRMLAVAWLLATAPESVLRSPERAVELAQEAVRLRPRNLRARRTLGVAHFRMGRWAQALTNLEEAMKRRSEANATDWLFVAMTKWHLGEKEEARTWLDMAVAWMAEHEYESEELGRFHEEAQRLLGDSR